MSKMPCLSQALRMTRAVDTAFSEGASSYPISRFDAVSNKAIMVRRTAPTPRGPEPTQPAFRPQTEHSAVLRYIRHVPPHQSAPINLPHRQADRFQLTVKHGAAFGFWQVTDVQRFTRPAFTSRLPSQDRAAPLFGYALFQIWVMTGDFLRTQDLAARLRSLHACARLETTMNGPRPIWRSVRGSQNARSINTCLGAMRIHPALKPSQAYPKGWGFPWIGWFSERNFQVRVLSY